MYVTVLSKGYQEKELEKGKSGGDEGKRKWDFYEINSRAGLEIE